jgi:dihydroorotate dehydrogenase
VYRVLIRPLLFLLHPELAHKLILKLLRLLYVIPGISFFVRLVTGQLVADLPVSLLGRDFPNPVGLAAGLDKNADCPRAFSDMGFGWVELGTVTPKKQRGNPGKRLFRYSEEAALINRMGFPSAGVDRFLGKLQRQKRRGIVGINIGKNRTTPISNATDDYLLAMNAAYPYADYIAVNISSPNTSGLRDLQNEAHLEKLLQTLKNEQVILTKTRRHYVPLVLKIAPDMDDDSIKVIAKQLLKHKWDGVIATNTTITRPGMEHYDNVPDEGGLSGAPLKDLSTEVVRKLYNQLQGKIPIIAAGGIFTANDAWEKLVAGADLVQIYTSFIYEGPAVVRRIVRGLERRVRTGGFASLAEALEKARSGIHLMR